MDSRERVMRTLRRERPDRAPIRDAPWQDTLARWYAEGLPQDVAIGDYFGFDIDFMSVDASPRFEQKLLSEDDEYQIYADRFGYTVKRAKFRGGTMDFMDHVTKDRAVWEADVKDRFVLDANDTARIDNASYFRHMDAYPTWPEARQKYDVIRQRDRYLLFDGYGPYEATWRHRGFTEHLMDLAADPDFVIEMAGTYTDLLISVLERCLTDGIRPDGFFMVDDLAHTRGMLMSPRTWRRIFKPFTYRLGQFLHDNDIAFWMHCCGNAEPIFDDLIECGLQVIQPLEAKSGLDVRELREKYGDQLTFWGNIDVIIMADGTDDEIEQEIRTKLTPFRENGGGYIYHSDHSVPPTVGLERFQLVLDLVRKYSSD